MYLYFLVIKPWIWHLILTWVDYSTSFFQFFCTFTHKLCSVHQCQIVCNSPNLSTICQTPDSKMGCNHWWNRHQGSMSSMFYKQLVCLQIPKAQKDWQLDCIFVLLGSACVKAAHRTSMKSMPGLIFLKQKIWKKDYKEFVDIPQNILAFANFYRRQLPRKIQKC